MRKLLYFVFIAAVLAINAGKTESYVFNTTDNASTIRWNLNNPATPIVQGGRVVYHLNPAGSDDVPFAQVESAIAASFKTWEDVPTSSIAFTRGANRTETGGRNDGLFQIYWREDSTVDDDLDLSGALAVTRLYTYSGGGRDGEIADVSLVFNGKEVQWATDGSASRIDIAEVAMHEIGHAIGLSHTPVGAATMFPRTGEGITRGRTLHADDQIAASVLYPANNFLAQAGTLRGRVRDFSGSGVFAANVVVTDGNGNVIATTLTQRDGNYRLQGLPPGTHTVFAGPLDPPGGLFFGVDDLNGYASANTNFLPSNDQAVTLNAGSETTLDLTVARATPAFRAQLVYQPASNSFTNLAASVQPGQSVTIGVGGPGLPASGSPLSVSGAGITILRVRFGALSGGSGNAIVADVTISANATPGARNLIVTANGQRTILAGALEIGGASTLPQTISVVSAANFAPRVAAESIVATFGTALATGTLAASGTPLPTLLGGTSVRLRDSQGNEQFAPLFYVSSRQINYQLPPGLLPGQTSVTITNSLGQSSTGQVQVEAVAPGLFSATGTGLGPAAAVVLRVAANGTQSFENLARYDSAQAKFVTIPIDLGPATDQVFLLLFGTGLRFRSSLSAVTVSVGGASQPVTFAGAQGSLVGLDQLNVRLSRNLAGRGEVEVSATVDGQASNAVRVNIK